MLEAEITANGDVVVEGQHVGALQGFRFLPDQSADGPDAKALRAAAQPPTAQPEGERWPGSPQGRSRPSAPAVDFTDLAAGGPTGYRSPGARKEALHHRRRRRRPPAGPLPELHAASAFSFLAGASLPEDLAERAAELEIPAVALLDRNGLYGTPRFHQAARRAGIRAIVGAEVEMGAGHPRLSLLVAERAGLIRAERRRGRGPMVTLLTPEPQAAEDD